MEHGSRKDQFVFGLFSSSNVGTIHSNEAAHHGEEPNGQPAHQQTPHCLNVI